MRYNNYWIVVPYQDLFRMFLYVCSLHAIRIETPILIEAFQISIKCLNNLAPISTVDFTSFTDMESAIRTIKKIKNIIPNRKYTIAGNIRVPTLGLCPLNNDSAIISRLSCKAPCHRGGFALNDPTLKKIYPFTCDGFCRMHMFEDKILEDFDNIDTLRNAGVNEFVFDFSALHSKFVPVLLNNFFQSRMKD